MCRRGVSTAQVDSKALPKFIGLDRRDQLRYADDVAYKLSVRHLTEEKQNLVSQCPMQVREPLSSCGRSETTASKGVQKVAQVARGLSVDQFECVPRH